MKVGEKEGGAGGRPSPRRSIRSRILLGSALATLGVAVVFASLYALIGDASFKRELRDKTAGTATRLAESLALPLWFYLTEACDLIVRSEMRDADIGAVYLYDKSEALISAAGRDASTGEIRSVGPSEERRFSSTARFISSRPINYRSETIGEVTIYATGAKALAKSGANLAEQVVLALLEGAIIAVLAFYMADRLISRRVLRMAGEISRFSERDLDARSDDRANDEVGDLSTSFNTMADTIRGYARDLEGIVAERTGELAQANDELSAKNAELSIAVSELTTTQDKLVESRRVAALGPLVAGMAHQLNTPLGAIASANRSIHEQITGQIALVSRRLSGLGEGELATLEDLLARSAAGEEGADFGQLRSRRREITELLRKAGHEDCAELAESIVEARLHALGPRLIELLATPRFREVLAVVEAVSAIRNSAAVITSASDKAANVIRALRVYLGQAPAEATTSVVLAAEIEEVLSIFRHLTRGGIELVTSLDPGLRVRGKRERLDLVWMNLIDNALQAMEGRGHLEIRAERRAGMARVTVIDSGHGISPEISGRIFDPFFTTKPLGGGMGLGLNTARKIIEDHEGAISFESAAGRTEFSVILPAEPPTG